MTLSRLSPMMEWRLVVGTIEVDDNVFPVVQCPPPPHTHTVSSPVHLPKDIERSGK